MREILAEAKKRGVAAELYRAVVKQTNVEFEHNHLRQAESAERAGLALRIIAKGRLGFATSSLPADESSLLEMALATAEFGKKVDFSFPGPAPVTPVDVYDSSVGAMTPEDLVSYGEQLIDPLRRADPKFKADVSLAAAETHVLMHNTAGFAGEVRKTVFGGSVGGILIEGENFLRLHEAHYNCCRNDSLVPLRDRVLADLRRGRRNVPLTSGRYQALFSPVACLALLGPILASLNGKAVQKGTSPFRGRLGEKLFNSTFTLYDDPLRPFFPASESFDAEGVPTARKALIEDGVLNGFFLDLDTAAKLGMVTTGNARRGGWASPPGPGSSTLALQPGATESGRLLAGLEEGLFVHHLMGAEQGNPYGGEINANLMLGFLVRKGEIVGRVKNVMLTLNVFELFRAHLAALSSDTETVYGGLILPYVLADGVSIVGR